MKKKIIFLIFTFSMSATAEYRVYQYIIKNKVQNSPDQPNSSIVESTLNPVTYLAYNGGASFTSVDLLRTWICPGNTAKKDICSSPYTSLTKVVLND